MNYLDNTIVNKTYNWKIDIEEKRVTFSGIEIFIQHILPDQKQNVLIFVLYFLRQKYYLIKVVVQNIP